MESVSGTYPAKFYPELAQKLEDTQDIDKVDKVAGATNSTVSFKTLVKTLLKENVKMEIPLPWSWRVRLKANEQKGRGDRLSPFLFSYHLHLSFLPICYLFSCSSIGVYIILEENADL